MSLQEYLDQIIDQNIIEKILNPNKESFPLGDFDNYKEIPIEWTKNININDFEKTYLNIGRFEKYIFIGMGGSISMARIASFINPSKIEFIDNFDISTIKNTKEILNNPSTAIFICSKSRNTLETAILDQIITTNKINKFYIQDDLKDKENILATPKQTGGRFSISTHLGILPFYLAGFNLDKIIANINKANKDCKSNQYNNPAIKIAAILFHNYKKNKKLFSIYSQNENDYIADWIEQLISESTGKEENGILPIKDINTIYPLISFSSNEDLFTDTKINLKIDYSESLFYKFQILMYAISIFCSLIDIQPFDQPNVESTKITTKSLLETKNIDDTSFLDKANLSALVKEIKENKGIISLLIHGTNIDIEQKKNLIKSTSKISSEDQRVLIFFAPNYLHSMGQLLKGSFKNIQNLVINLHGNEDLNIPNSLYTLNTFVKKQGYSDHLELIKNERKSLYFETNYEELMKNLNNLIND